MYEVIAIKPIDKMVKRLIQVLLEDKDYYFYEDMYIGQEVFFVKESVQLIQELKDELKRIFKKGQYKIFK